jgi:cytidyltransferase-like protein
MAHLHESTDLTFNDIADALTKIAQADITATEKVDGQNLFITVDDQNRLRAARNLGDLRKGGMAPKEFSDKWKGHPAESAFTGGFEALELALNQLSAQELRDLFAQGQRYVNLEVMYPGNPNMVVYSGAQIVLHGASDLDPDGRGTTETPESREAFQALSAALDAAEVEVNQEIWRVNGPAIMELKDISDGSALQEAVQQIEQLAAPVGMDATLGDYVALRLEENLLKRDFPEEKIPDMIAAVLDREGAPNSNQLKKGLSKEQKKIVSAIATKTSAHKYIAEVLAPLEMAVHVFATEVLRGIKSFFVDDAEAEGKEMRQELDRAIKFLEDAAASGDKKAGQVLEKQLSKLEAAGLDDIMSTIEGLVFEYPPGSGNIKKITGNFAPLNQIVGRARRAGMPGRLDSPAEVQESRKSLKLVNYLFESLEPTANPSDKTVGLVPMSAKPFHDGHWWLIGEAARDNDEVIVFVSTSDRKRKGQHTILGSDMKDIWNDYLEPIMPANVKIEYGGSPVRKVYEVVGDAAEKAAAGQTVETTFRVYSDKTDTAQNYPEKNRQKYMQPLYDQGRIEFPGEAWQDRSETSVTTSGTGMRLALQQGDFDTFAAGMPAPLSDEAVQAIFDKLS